MTAEAARIIAAICPNPTDWVSITLASGFTTQSGAYTVAVRFNFDEAELCGSVNATSIATGGVTIGTLPAAYWPTHAVRLAVAAGVSGTVTGALVISTAGVMTAQVASTVSNVALDGLRYRLT